MSSAFAIVRRLSTFCPQVCMQTKSEQSSENSPAMQWTHIRQLANKTPPLMFTSPTVSNPGSVSETMVLVCHTTKSLTSTPLTLKVLKQRPMNSSAHLVWDPRVLSLTLTTSPLQRLKTVLKVFTQPSSTNKVSRLSLK